MDFPSPSVIPKFVTGAGFTALVLSGLTLALTPEANGYEASIYQVYPVTFWIFIIVALTSGLVVILLGSSRPGGQYWRFGLLLVLITQAVLLFMPYIRGYPIFGRGDVLTHIGHIKTISDIGHVPKDNFYPNFHFLVLTLSYATGIKPTYVINAVTSVFSIFYIGSGFFLLRNMFEDRSLVFFTIPFLALPLGEFAHLNPSPYAQSILIIPFIFYLFVKAQRTSALSIRIALAFGLIAIVIYHPLTALLLLFTFALYGVARLSVIWTSDEDARATKARLASRANGSSLLGATFIAWYYNFAGIVNRFERIINTLLTSKSGSSGVQKYNMITSAYSPTIIDIARIGLLRWGISMVLFGFGFLGLIFSPVNVYKEKIETLIYRITINAAFLAFFALSLLFFIFDFIVGWERILHFVKVFGAIMTGFLFYSAFWQFRGEKLKSVSSFAMLFIILLVLSVLAIFSLYPAPVSSNMNPQMTQMELDGGEWVFENKNPAFNISEYGFEQGRVYGALYGFEAYEGANESIRKDNTRPPAHFNYTNHSTLGRSYDRPTYLIVTKKGKLQYPAQFPDYRPLWPFYPADFARLNRDPTVNRIYTNGEFDTYLITIPNRSVSAAQNFQENRPVSGG